MVFGARGQAHSEANAARLDPGARLMTDAIERYGQLSPWKPEALAGWKVGDLADVQTIGRVQVVELKPPSEIVVRVQSGATCRVGWRALKRIARSTTDGPVHD